MGADETFSRDTDDPAVVRRELLLLAGRGHAPRMRTAAGRGAPPVTLRVRFADFTTITRSRTLSEATDGTQDVYREAVRLYDALGLQRARIRLVGVRVEGLVARSRVQRQCGSASVSTGGPRRRQPVEPGGDPVRRPRRSSRPRCCSDPARTSRVRLSEFFDPPATAGVAWVPRL